MCALSLSIAYASQFFFFGTKRVRRHTQPTPISSGKSKWTVKQTKGGKHETNQEFAFVELILLPKKKNAPYNKTAASMNGSYLNT